MSQGPSKTAGRKKKKKTAFMEQGPLVSVIIPAFRRKELITRALDSVCASSHPHLEILVADDGSDDGTLEAIHEASRKDPRIQAIALNHSGVSAARNAALDKATGDYVFFMDSDDMIHPELIRKELEALKGGKADFVICDQLRLSKGKCVTWSKNSRPSLTYPDAEKTRRTFFLQPDLLTRVIGMMADRQLIGSERFDASLTCCEDTEFTYRLITKGLRWCHLKESWYYYHHSETSLTSCPTLERLQSVSTATERIFSMEMASGPVPGCRLLLGWVPSYLVRSALSDTANPQWEEEIRSWIRDKKQKGLYKEIPLKNRMALHLAQSSPLARKALKTAIRSKQALLHLL